MMTEIKIAAPSIQPASLSPSSWPPTTEGHEDKCEKRVRVSAGDHHGHGDGEARERFVQRNETETLLSSSIINAKGESDELNDNATRNTPKLRDQHDHY